jgi:hypothetical protein
MKKITIVFYCVLFFSCKSQQITFSPFVAVYKNDWVGNVYPTYVILKTQPKVFEIYAPGIYESMVGEWNINNDTLFLFPQYEYFSRNSELKFSEITPKDSSVATIPQQYLIKNDCLIDITDYSVVLQELSSNQNNKKVYKRITEQ